MTVIPAGKSYPIVGIQEGRGEKPGQVPLRREIDEWWFAKDENSLNQRSLFIYALNNFQKRGYRNDDLSYFSVAGIHGLPLLPWPQKDTGTGFYCSHGKYTFSVWHTPYMLLYEQRLYEEMTALIPDTFDQGDQEAMLKAAHTWRLPYWDWAAKKPDWDDQNPDSPQNFKPGSGVNVPYIITQRQVPVKVKGQAAPALVENPMFHYALPEGQKFGDYQVKNTQRMPWIETCRVTSRHPQFANIQNLDARSWNDGRVTAQEKEDYAEGTNQDWTIITEQLRGDVASRIGDPDQPGKTDAYYANSLPEAVKRLFRSTVDGDDNTPVMDFKHFTTNVYHYKQQVEAYPSLEAIHNNLHGFSGGFGYMGSPATSAFDPIFWLHHCNVDRLLAIWQELYSKQYKEWLALGNDGQRDPNDRSGPGVPNTKLTPFSMDENKTIFNAEQTSYKSAQFGYTYPELQEWNYIKNGEVDHTAYHNDIKGRIDRLYTTTDKSALLLPENQVQMVQQMANMTAANIELENFPAPLLEHAEQKAVDSATTDIRGVSAYKKAEFGDAVPDLSWSNDDYVVNVLYERFALGGDPYSVTVFLGPVPDHNVYNFARDESAIGEVYNFSAHAEGRGVDEGGCGSCKVQAEEGALFTGQIILTDALIQLLFDASRGSRPRLESLKQEHVVPYLKENLHWRITDAYGQDVDRANMPSLKVSVATAKATHYSEPGRFSEYTPYTTLYEVTSNRPAGLSQADSADIRPQT